ncbi:hypothetical protein BZL30_0319 [Mycobacterium kansasii]|uniref:Uncharacterized protein n=1 Tax=Mycobacterium kansasii TaxID=1768 RepID=A0A1V3XUR4_MYCKA|nr:hypothetical protein BZL30_0319 [Mycobacterium kansasii]
MNISAELAEIATYGGFFALSTGRDDAGWHPVVQSYSDGFADLVKATAQRYHTAELRIGASLVHLGHAARLWSPVLACALAHGVLPDLSDLQRADDTAQLRLPEPVGEPVPAPRSSRTRCTALSCATTWNSSRPALRSSWPPACYAAISRPHSSERPACCCRYGPTCGCRSSKPPLPCCASAGWPPPACSPARPRLQAAQLLPVLSGAGWRHMRRLPP